MKFDKWLAAGTWWLFLAGSTYFMARLVGLMSTSPVAADAGLRVDPLPTDGGSTFTNVLITATPAPSTAVLTMTGATSGNPDGGTWHRYFPTAFGHGGYVMLRSRWVSDAEPSKEFSYPEGSTRPCIRGCAAMYYEAMNQQQYEERTYPDETKMSAVDQDAWFEGVHGCMDACESTGAGKLSWPMPRYPGP